MAVKASGCCLARKNTQSSRKAGMRAQNLYFPAAHWFSMFLPNSFGQFLRFGRQKEEALSFLACPESSRGVALSKVASKCKHNFKFLLDDFEVEFDTVQVTHLSASSKYLNIWEILRILENCKSLNGVSQHSAPLHAMEGSLTLTSEWQEMFCNFEVKDCCIISSPSSRNPPHQLYVS